MASPWSLISAYAPEVLKDYINGYRKVHIYVDLKNVMTSLFIKEVCEEIVANTLNMGTLDSTIFQAIIAYSIYWKKYCSNLGLPCEIFICCDIGRSEYHRRTYNRYKERRLISNQMLGGLDDERMLEIKQKNFEISETIINRIPDVHFLNLKFLEADFLPHYLINEKFNDPDIFHIITSSDKDMFQTVTTPNIVMIYKSRGNVRKLIDHTTTYANYIKIEKLSVKSQIKKAAQIKKLDPKHMAAVMALVGDMGDDVPGVKGIGPSIAIDVFSQLEMIKNVVDMTTLDSRVSSGGKFFIEDVVPLKNMDKKLQKVFLENDVVTTAYKLISYDMLIDWLKKPDMTEKKDWINYIDDVLSKKKYDIIPSARSFYMAMQNLNDCHFEEGTLLPLF